MNSKKVNKKVNIKQWSSFVLFLFFVSFFGPGLSANAANPARQEVDLVKLKKEEEKRKKKLKKSKYVVTNESLKNLDKTKGKGSLSKASGSSGTGEKAKESTSTESLPTQTDASADSPVDEEQRQRDEKCKFWQKKKTDLIYEIYKTKADIKDMIAEYNNIVKEFDLVTGDTQIKMMERGDELLKEIDNAKKRIVEMETEMAELDNKARKDGVPPGCLREIEYPPSKN